MSWSEWCTMKGFQSKNGWWAGLTFGQGFMALVNVPMSPRCVYESTSLKHKAGAIMHYNLKNHIDVSSFVRHLVKKAPQSNATTQLRPPFILLTETLKVARGAITRTVILPQQVAFTHRKGISGTSPASGWQMTCTLSAKHKIIMHLRLFSSIDYSLQQSWLNMYMQ